MNFEPQKFFVGLIDFFCDHHAGRLDGLPDERLGGHLVSTQAFPPAFRNDQPPFRRPILDRLRLPPVRDQVLVGSDLDVRPAFPLNNLEAVTVFLFASYLLGHVVSLIQWVLPKGHIEPGEAPRVCAVREVHEETGNWARVKEYIGDSSLGKGKHAPKVRWFLMELVEGVDTWPKENRQQLWLSLADAIKRATYSETRAILKVAATGG